MNNPLPKLKTLLLFLWMAVIILTLNAFYYYDWDHGVARFFLLVLLGAVGLSFMRSAPDLAHSIRPNSAANKLILVLVIFLMGFNLNVGFKNFQKARAKGYVPGDQAQSLSRAINALWKGTNPYGQGVIFDYAVYVALAQELLNKKNCGVIPPFTRDGLFSAFWISRAPKPPAGVIPAISNLPECNDARNMVADLGFRYGPGQLVFHSPAVILFKEPGILLDHMIIFSLLSFCLFLWFYQESKSLFYACVPLLILLVPVHIRWNNFNQGHLDLLPSFFAILFLWATSRSKDRSAAFLLGLSVSTKVFPGLLYAPLLLRKPKSLPFFFLSILLFISPFLLWDWKRFCHNQIYSVLLIPIDSTSLRWYLPTWAGPFVFGGFIFIIFGGLLLVRKMRWTMPWMSAYVFVAHLATYAAGRLFHNNYVVWIIPMTCVFVFYSMQSDGDKASGLGLHSN